MFTFITLENIISFLIDNGINLDILLLSDIQKSYLLIGGNLLFLLGIIFILSISYKILLKLFNWFF